MMYPYLTLADGTEVVHSELLDGDRGGRVLVHFERPNPNGFDSVRFELPSYHMEVWEGGFSDDELRSLREFLEANAHLLYRYAAQGGPTSTFSPTTVGGYPSRTSGSSWSS